MSLGKIVVVEPFVTTADHLEVGEIFCFNGEASIVYMMLCSNTVDNMQAVHLTGGLVGTTVPVRHSQAINPLMVEEGATFEYMTSTEWEG